MFKKATLTLLPLMILLTLLGGSHLAARTPPTSDVPLIRLQLATFDPLAGVPDIPDGQRLTISAEVRDQGGKLLARGKSIHWIIEEHE